MITLKGTKPTDRVLELGGGDNPQVRPNCDVRPGPNVDIVADFNNPLPFQTSEWDAVFSQFAIEHISYPRVIPFLQEVHRILKPGGKFICVMPNTQAQLQWIADHPEGWDNKGPFEASSELLFGSQDYAENSHKAYFSPGIIHLLFTCAGFEHVQIHAYNERKTDMCVVGVRPQVGQVQLVQTPDKPAVPDSQMMAEMEKQMLSHTVIENYTREELYDKHYWTGGGKVGGYAREGYRDFPTHHLTAQHILARKPTSVLEIGSARNYIIKRLQDAGVTRSAGLEISKHCYMTRVADPILKQDVCQTPWGIDLRSDKFDLAFSIAVFEHIPESFLPGVLGELARLTKRGLHGIDFGQNDDGFDKTHVNLKSKSAWREIFDKHGLQSHEIVDKEELERWSSDVTPQWYEDTIIKGDGKLKLNVGCGMTMYHYGWHNIDVLDYNALAQHERYLFRQHDVRNGLPYDTNSVDCMHISHLLEHLTYEEGLKFLRECRRVIKPGGVIRFACVDAELPTHLYSTIGSGVDGEKLSDFDEISDACERAKSNAGKLHALLWDGRQAIYDWDSLNKALQEAGFSAVRRKFREGLILKETLDMVPALSFFAEATPSET